MATYKSNSVRINQSAETFFDRFSDLTNLQELLNRVPEEQRAQVGQVEFTPDSLKIGTSQVGDIIFKVVERQRPTLVKFGTPSSPVPLNMQLDITPAGDSAADVTASIDVELPAMLRPMVGPHIQKAVDKFGELITMLGNTQPQ